MRACKMDAHDFNRESRSPMEFPDKWTIIGGAHISACPDDFNDSKFDAAVVGEGEIALARILNVGSGKAVTIKDLAATMLKIYSMENKPMFAEPRANDVFKLEADTSLAKTYGYEPKVSLEEGLTKYIAWWRE